MLDSGFGWKSKTQQGVVYSHLEPRRGTWSGGLLESHSSNAILEIMGDYKILNFCLGSSSLLSNTVCEGWPEEEPEIEGVTRYSKEGPQMSVARATKGGSL